MNITSLLSKDLVFFLESTEKEAVIRELIEKLHEKKLIKKKEQIIKKVLEREALGSTGIGKGVAIPHCKIKEIKKPIVAAGVNKEGIDFDSNDKKPTYLVILVISPTENPTYHLQILAAAAHLAQKSDSFMKNLRNSTSSIEVYEILKEAELSES